MLVTAHDEALVWNEARSAGIHNVLPKPVSASSLHDALSEAIAQGPDAAAPVEPASDAFRILQATRRNARVLLVEDNAVNQEVAVELLRSAGLCVHVANNGLEALAMAREGSYDLILMDVQMPEMDGLQATRALRAMPGLAGVPIVAMTANAFSEDRDACVEAGMNDHVAKPVDPDLLYTTLLRWLPSPQSHIEPGGLELAESRAGRCCGWMARAARDHRGR